MIHFHEKNYISDAVQVSTYSKLSKKNTGVLRNVVHCLPTAPPAVERAVECPEYNPVLLLLSSIERKVNQISNIQSLPVNVNYNP